MLMHMHEIRLPSANLVTLYHIIIIIHTLPIIYITGAVLPYFTYLSGMVVVFLVSPQSSCLSPHASVLDSLPPFSQL